MNEIPKLIRLGVTGFKIEGRLETPEYVAATCQVYRQALDAATGVVRCDTTGGAHCRTGAVAAGDQYKLEMAFSRGLYTGWLHGVNHQELVHGRFGKKRGPFVGFIERVDRNQVEVAPRCPLRPGDGVVFDTGGDPDNEQGGRIWEIRDKRLFFERGRIDFSQLEPGDRIWKTSDPQLERALRQTFQGELARPKKRLDLRVSGEAGEPLVIESGAVRVASRMPLQTAFKRPLTQKLRRDQLGRLGETDFVLGDLENRLVGQVILPVSELNRLRREMVSQLDRGSDISFGRLRTGSVAIRPAIRSRQECRSHRMPSGSEPGQPQLVVLCRTMEQIRAALETGCETVYVDFEDIRRYRDAVTLVRSPAPRSSWPRRASRKPASRGFSRRSSRPGRTAC